MRTLFQRCCWLLFVIVLIFSPLNVGAQNATKQRALIVIDANGKVQNITNWELTEGVWEMTWLAPDAGKVVPPDVDDKEKKPAGQLALAFRETDSTQFREGIFTLIPLSSVRSISYDYEKKQATVRVASSDKEADDVLLTGSAAEYRDINTVTIRAEVDKGELGVAEVKYQGGIKNGIRELRFESAEPMEAMKGSRATFKWQSDGEKTTEATDLTALYQSEGGKITAGTLFFRKTIKVELDQLSSLARAEGDKNGLEWKLTLKKGDIETFTLLQPANLNDKTIKLLGLLGRTKAGYRLFPLHVLTRVDFAKE